MKKLLITSTDLMMIQFLVPHVRHLSENGFHVEIACSEVGGRMEEVRKAVEGFAQAVHTVRLVRSPVSPTNFKGYGDMKRLLSENHYDIIWTNEPVMGVVTRLAARKSRRQGTKVVYMCHGFHFYKGAGLANWLIYYPVERVMSRLTDVLVTINREDEARAKTMHAKRVEYIHGIGVDPGRFQNSVGSCNIREELGIGEEKILMLSVGELNGNKNHQVVIRALAQLEDERIHYAICGKGDLLEKLKALSEELGVAGQVHFLGYRKEIPAILRKVDVFVHPSFREGLSLAVMEAMQAGLPVICSRIRGNVDLITDGEGGLLCAPHVPEEFSQAINKIQTMDVEAMASANRKKLLYYDLEQVKENIHCLFSALY